MSTIGGPGGIGGPKGPGGPEGPGELDAAEATDATDAADAAGAAAGTGAAGLEQAAAAGGTGDIDALAAEVAAGRLTPHEALERLIDATAGPELGAAERAELREILSEMIASDPYLGALAGRI